MSSLRLIRRRPRDGRLVFGRRPTIRATTLLLGDGSHRVAFNSPAISPAALSGFTSHSRWATHDWRRLSFSFATHHGRTLRNPTSVLADDGSIINKRALGRVSFNAAIKLSDDTEVEQAVHLAPNVEVDLAEMAGGPRPLWVIPSADGIANFPTLAGVEVTVIER